MEKHGGRRLRLHLIRHGETDWNVEGRIQGWTDIALNDRGRKQAAALAAASALADTGVVLSSDLARAVQTAGPLAACLGVPLRTDARFRERNLGELAGLAVSSGDGHAFVFRMVNDPSSRPAGGEALSEFRLRVADAVRELVAEPPAEAVAIVTHGGAVRAALVALLGADCRDLVPQIGNCMVVTLDVTAGGAARWVGAVNLDAATGAGADEAAS